MKTTTTLFIAMFLLLAGCKDGGTQTAASSSSDSSAQTSSEGKGDVIATVNDTKIHAIRISIYTPATAGQNISPAEIVENIITSELISQAALSNNMHQDPTISEQLAIAEQTVLGRAYTQNFLEEHPVDEQTVLARYEELKTEFANGHEYLSAHILVQDEALATDLHAQITADGKKFAELATKHSIDTGSAAQGGSLGWLESRVLVKEYADALESSEAGTLVPQPVQTQYGFHIIRVDEKRPLTVPELNDELRNRIEQTVRAEKFTTHLDELRTNATIVRN
ncbi:MAG: peptidylprolyl isomerase [Gammaproteobacteria bacterium WSBS_2016_MAG_OTU1]